MLSLENSVKYIGLAAIIYFLIKAFTNNLLSNWQIALFVIIIMIVIIFIIEQKTACDQNRKTREGFQEVKQTEILNNDENKIDPDTNIENIEVIDGIERIMDEDQIDQGEFSDDQVGNLNKSNKIDPASEIPPESGSYGYTYMPPEYWFRVYDNPPRCITSRPCQVCPSAGLQTYGYLELDAESKKQSRNKRKNNRI